MTHARARTMVATVALVAPLLASDAGAAPHHAASVLSRALGDGARYKSFTLSGEVSGPGGTLTLDGGFSPAGNGGLSTVSNVGTEYEISPLGKTYCVVKATTVAVLKQALFVKSPRASEVNLWYRVTSKDPRFLRIDTPSSAQTVAEFFSFSPAGWRRTADDEGTTTLHGVRVIKLKGASAFFNPGTFATTTLYVTDVKDPLPYAMSGPTGTTGVFYFTNWNATTVTIPFTDVNLPA